MIAEQFFEDYEIGCTRRSFGRTITEADIVLHAGQTGDFFPASHGRRVVRHPGLQAAHSPRHADSERSGLE